MAAVDDLQFEEFGDGATLLAANPDATTINIEDPSVSFKHQPRPPGSLGREEDEELLGTNDSDETEAYFFDAPEMDHLPAAITTPNQTVAAAKSS
ncbi:Yip1 domain family, member 1, isoform CRA_d [Rattus norvegicus]|uniref:Yip1 domain family, member 1, isoform CRA_d n=1 Tax=Rattus norvegicus TaxID=10116 RepID=A6JYR9_RAT|nr:Yip1 domain family, member 1, isoform CRA_d [Rattus norvegicus]